MKPVIVVGAGPVGLTTALGLDFYGLPVQAFGDEVLFENQYVRVWGLTLDPGGRQPWLVNRSACRYCNILVEDQGAGLRQNRELRPTACGAGIGADDQDREHGRR